MSVAPVSVVIPFYNGHAWIQRAINSIEQQTLPPAEIVVVDDGSVEPFTLSPGSVPVRVVRHDANRGIPSARNSGVAVASQPWIAFLDQDDEWLPHKLAVQWESVSAVENPERCVFYGRALRPLDGSESAPLIAWPRTSTARRLDRSPDTALKELALRGNPIPFITVLVSAEACRSVGGFDESLRGGSDDYALLLRLAAHGIAFRFVDGAGAIARRHETGANYSNAVRFMKDDIAALESLARDVPAARRLLNRSVAAANYRAGRGLLQQDSVQARIHLHRALRMRPFYPRALISALAASSPGFVRNIVLRLWGSGRALLYRH